MAVINNNLNSEMSTYSFLRYAQYNSNTTVSRERYLNILGLQHCPIQTSSKVRRSKWLLNSQKVSYTNIQTDMDDNKDCIDVSMLWSEIQHSAESSCNCCNSESNPSIHNKNIVH